MIKRESITQLKEAVDVVAIVKEYLPHLRRSGKNYFANCPFHGERTPSFSVAADKKMIHCFGCGYHGDIIKFVQDMEHISYVESVEKIAKKSHVTLEYEAADKEKYDEKRLIHSVLKDIAAMYHEILLNGKIAAPARAYLAQRGITPASIESFQLGYAPDGNYLLKHVKKYDLATLSKAGVVHFYVPQDERDELKRYDHPYDYFRNRILFPVFDSNGRVVSFGGRLLPAPEQTSPGSIPVYLNEPETPVYTKGAHLCGLFQAKDEIIKQKALILVEGYMDVVILSQEGLKNVVAPLGTSFTEQQLKLVKRFTDTIYLMFDADKSGQQAAISCAQMIYAGGFFPQLVSLPEGMDPDEFILQHGQEKMVRLIAQWRTAVSFYVQYFLTLHQQAYTSHLGTKQKMELFHKLVAIVRAIAHPVASAEAVKEIANELVIPEETVRAALRTNQHQLETLPHAPRVAAKPYTCEEELLWLCIHYPSVIQQIPQEVFDHDVTYHTIFQKLKTVYLATKDIHLVVDTLEAPLRDLLIQMIFDEREMQCPIETRIAKLYQDMLKIKYKKRYQELKPIVTEMLEEKRTVNVSTVNEYKQLIEALKKIA